MKKTLLVLIAFFTITLVSAQFTDGDYTFTVVGSDAYVSGTTATGDVTFPTSATNSATSITYNVTGVSSSFTGFGGGITTAIIPMGYKTFQANCFRGMTSLTSIVFHDGEVFGDKAFRNLDSLISVVLPPNTITSFGAQMFWQSDNLSSVDLGGLTTLPNQAFRECPAMTTLTIPATMTAFGLNSFQGTNIATLMVEGAVPATIDAGWNGAAASITAYVPTANVTAYENAPIWGDMTIKDKAILLDSQVVVNNLADLRAVVTLSDREITLAPGNYNLENDLPTGSRVITFSGSNNTITLTGAFIKVPVGCVKESYLVVSGNNNTIIGGDIEDIYRNGLTEITDFSAYNQDRANLAYGLGGAAVMRVSGADNLVNGIKLTVRGSYPYGYGSMYGIGSDNVYGLDKRCGLLITGLRNTIDNVELQQRAFGHGIYMQGNADETVIKNTLVEGRMRPTGELYNETNTYDLPYRSDYKLPLNDNAPIPTDEMHTLCEDAFRMYDIPGSITIQNCTAKKMRGGIRLYLGGTAIVSNSTAIDCDSTNFNLSAGGNVTNSSGNFSYGPLSDFRLGRSNMNLEWTIIPSPHAMGPHNILDVLGNNHRIVLHRTPGPIDETDRAIVVTGKNSTITNETEYDIVLESTTSGNTIRNCGGGTVTDNGTNNTILTYATCEEINNACPKTADLMEAECYDSMLGVQLGESSEGGSNIGYINNGDWVKFRNIDLSGVKSVNARVAGKYNDCSIEVRLGSETGTLIATIPVSNTGDWQTWVTDSVNIPSFTEGVYDVYFVFKGTRTGYLFNVNWFSFSAQALSVNSNSMVDNVNIYPNPVKTELTVSLANANFIYSDTKITLFDVKGQKVMEVSAKSNGNTTLDLSSVQSGIYVLKISDKTRVITKKIVKI